jgi:hypothetical protein
VKKTRSRWSLLLAAGSRHGETKSQGKPNWTGAPCVGDLPVPSTTFEDRSRQQEEWRADRRAGLSRTHELELNFDASTRTAPGREGLMHTNQNEVSAPELNRACDGRTNPGLPHTHERRAGSETVHGELKG